MGTCQSTPDDGTNHDKGQQHEKPGKDNKHVEGNRTAATTAKSSVSDGGDGDTANNTNNNKPPRSPKQRTGKNGITTQSQTTSTSGSPHGHAILPQSSPPSHQRNGSTFGHLRTGGEHGHHSSTSPAPSPLLAPVPSPSAIDEQIEALITKQLPKGKDELKSLVAELQAALGTYSQSLREKDRELASEKAQRAQAATGVLNQAMKIIRPASSSNGGSGGMQVGMGGKRDSFNGLCLPGTSPTSPHHLHGPHHGHSSSIHALSSSHHASSSLIQLHEMQKAAAAEVAQMAAANAQTSESANSAAANLASQRRNSSATDGDTLLIDAGTNMAIVQPVPSVPSSLSSTSSILPAPRDAFLDASNFMSDSPSHRDAAAAGGGAVDDDNTLRRELMDVLLAFAENELIAPNIDRYSSSSGGSQTESFSAVINNSTLDDVTKAWLTAEYTRDTGPPPGTHGTRQRHSSVVSNPLLDKTPGSSGRDIGSHPGHNQGSNGNLSVNNNRSGNANNANNGNNASGNNANGGGFLLNPNTSRLLSSPDSIPLEELESWNFDPTAYKAESLIQSAYKIFESLDLLKRFNIPSQTLTNFLRELDNNYIASNPYHNFMHGIDVLHCCWMYLKNSSIIQQARLRSLDIFAFLISSISHDLGHPGLNNNYHITTQSELARIYNDVSVLENYHTATAFRILSTSQDCNIMQGLNRDEWLEARKIIISCILSTDMSHHFEMVAGFDPLFEKLELINEANRIQLDNETEKNTLANSTTTAASTSITSSSNVNGLSTMSYPISGLKRLSTVTKGMELITTQQAKLANTDATTANLPSSPLSPRGSTSVPPTTSAGVGNSLSSTGGIQPPELTRDEIIRLLNVLLHSADISNPSKPWKIAKVWSDRIQSENFAQGDLERKKSLAVSPFMDRSLENQPQTSINFIDFIVSPLLCAIVRALPSLVPLAENLIKNRKIWHQSLLDKLALPLPASADPKVTAAQLAQREIDKKSLINKAQIFRTCFVLPVRKIIEENRISSQIITNAANQDIYKTLPAGGMGINQTMKSEAASPVIGAMQNASSNSSASSTAANKSNISKTASAAVSTTVSPVKSAFNSKATTATSGTKSTTTSTASTTASGSDAKSSSSTTSKSSASSTDKTSMTRQTSVKFADDTQTASPRSKPAKDSSANSATEKANAAAAKQTSPKLTPAVKSNSPDSTTAASASSADKKNKTANINATASFASSATPQLNRASSAQISRTSNPANNEEEDDPNAAIDDAALITGLGLLSPRRALTAAAAASASKDGSPHRLGSVEGSDVSATQHRALLAADALLKSVATIVKRRHSMLEAHALLSESIHSIHQQQQAGGGGGGGAASSSSAAAGTNGMIGARALSTPHSPSIRSRQNSSSKSSAYHSNPGLSSTTMLLPSSAVAASGGGAEPTVRRRSLKTHVKEMFGTAAASLGSASTSSDVGMSAEESPRHEVDMDLIGSSSTVPRRDSHIVNLDDDDDDDTVTDSTFLSPVLSPESRAVAHALAQRTPVPRED